MKELRYGWMLIITVVSICSCQKANDNLIEKDGFVNLSKAEVAAINGLDGYAIAENKVRLGYQRPKKLETN